MGGARPGSGSRLRDASSQQHQHTLTASGLTSLYHSPPASAFLQAECGQRCSLQSEELHRKAMHGK